MATPVFPNGFKPVIAGYETGEAGGVQITEVMGGSPRIAMLFDRGCQPFKVSMVITPDKYSIWEIFYKHIIKKGSIQFIMPLDSGFGLQSHTCIMVPGSYTAQRIAGQITGVSFTVLAESRAWDWTADDARNLLELWQEYGQELNPTLDQLEILCTIKLHAQPETLVPPV